jgi:Neuraminidase (sialidase)
MLQNGLEEQPTASFALDMDVGVGLESGDDPKVSLRTSKDGGKTWSNELIRSIGKVGEYSKRVIWNRVGGGRKVVFEVTITDPVKRNIVGAYVS